MNISFESLESDGGFFVPDEFVIPMLFRYKQPSMMIQRRVEKRGIVGRMLCAIGNEHGYVWEDTPEYLEFKAEYERQHPRN